MQRFAQWFNRKYGRAAGLWESRFKSVLVEFVRRGTSNQAWSGARESGVCRRGVSGVPGAVWGKAQERAAQVAEQCGGCRGVVKC